MFVCCLAIWANVVKITMEYYEINKCEWVLSFCLKTEFASIYYRDSIYTIYLTTIYEKDGASVIIMKMEKWMMRRNIIVKRMLLNPHLMHLNYSNILHIDTTTIIHKFTILIPFICARMLYTIYM